MFITVDNIVEAFKSPLFIDTLLGYGFDDVKPEVTDFEIIKSGKHAIVLKVEINGIQHKAVKILNILHPKIIEIDSYQESICCYLSSLQSSYFVNYRYLKSIIKSNNDSHPVVIMDWCDSYGLKAFINNNYTNSKLIRQIAEKFRNMASYLHLMNISHGDLHNENIRVTSDNNLVLIDYESMCVPEIIGKKEVLKGPSAYQHRIARANNQHLSLVTDYYSELVIYLSLILISHYPELWTEKVSNNKHVLLFSEKDIMENAGSILYQFKDEQADQIALMIKTLQNWRNNEFEICNFKPLENILN